MRFKKIAAFILILFVTGFVGYGVSNQRIAPSFQEKETIKPIIDIPTSILKQERSEFINLWGVPVNEDYNIGTTEEVLTYYTPDFKLKIKFFTGTPIEIDVIPLKEYKISDVMRLLSDLGFGKDLEKVTDSGQTVFFYKTTLGDITREYEIHVECTELTIVNRVYIKLISS